MLIEQNSKNSFFITLRNWLYLPLLLFDSGFKKYPTGQFGKIT